MSRKEKNKVDELELTGKERKKGRKGALVCLYCVILTAVLYAFLLYVEKVVLREEQVADVYIASKDIEEGVLIDEANAAQYFNKVSRALSILPNGYVTDLTVLYNMFTTRDYVAKDVITTAGFTSEADKTADIINPVEISIATSSLAQAVGGILRTGDYINIWSVTESSLNGTSEITAERVCEHVYVSKAFNSSGVQLVRGADTEDSAATIISIIMSEEDEEDFNVALAQGTIRFALCMYDERQVIDSEKDKKSEQETSDSDIEIPTEETEIGPVYMSIPTYTDDQLNFWREAQFNTTGFYQDEFGNLMYSDDYDFSEYYNELTGEITIGGYVYSAELREDGTWYIPASINAALAELTINDGGSLGE